MKTIAEKIRDARKALKLTQTELGEKADLSLKSIYAYEKGDQVPRLNTIRRLAKALGVTVKYLTDDTCDDPLAGAEEDDFLDEAHTLYGEAGYRDAKALLDANLAFFAGGELPQEEKDAFFQAVMQAYIASSKAAVSKSNS